MGIYIRVRVHGWPQQGKSLRVFKNKDWYKHETRLGDCPADLPEVAAPVRCGAVLFSGFDMYGDDRYGDSWDDEPFTWHAVLEGRPRLTLSFIVEDCCIRVDAPPSGSVEVKFIQWRRF